MKTLSAIEALAGALEMLERIRRGGSYPLGEYCEREQAYRQALDSAREREMKDERNRAAIRALAERRRTA